MPVRIRLQRQGRKKRPFFFIVAADSRAPRDGKFIQKIGTYNPLTQPAEIKIDREAALSWLEKGAQPSDTVHRILSYKGVLYLKHLKRGVKLGLFDESVVTEKFDEWLSKHEGTIQQQKDAQQASFDKQRAEAEEAVKKAREEVEAKKAEEAKAAEEAAAQAQAAASEKAAPEEPKVANENTQEPEQQAESDAGTEAASQE